MDKIVAKCLMSRLLELNNAMDAVGAQIELIEVETQKREFKKSIASLILTVYGDLMRPIIKEHPEFDPDK